MAALNFKYGELSNLPKNNDGTDKLSEGCIYVTTDERAIYVDLPVKNEKGNSSSASEATLKRIRIGNFIEYESLSALQADKDNWSTSTLAFINDKKLLAKYVKTNELDKNGKPIYEWIAINDPEDLTGRVSTLEARATNLESRDVELQGSIDKNAKDIADEIEERKSEVNKLYEHITKRMQEADAMTYKSTLKRCEQKTVGGKQYWLLVLPEEEISAGDTYKVGGGFINASNEQAISGITFVHVVLDRSKTTLTVSDLTPVYAGDLLIAPKDQQKTEGEGETVTWTPYAETWDHVSSGYEDDYKPYLQTSTLNIASTGQPANNKTTVKLFGGAGEDQGQILFISDNDNLKVTTSVITDYGTKEDIKVSFNLEWGTFE